MSLNILSYRLECFSIRFLRARKVNAYQDGAPCRINNFNKRSSLSLKGVKHIQNICPWHSEKVCDEFYVLAF
jgi:hypothetical protein